MGKKYRTTEWPRVERYTWRSSSPTCLNRHFHLPVKTQSRWRVLFTSYWHKAQADVTHFLRECTSHQGSEEGKSYFVYPVKWRCSGKNNQGNPYEGKGAKRGESCSPVRPLAWLWKYLVLISAPSMISLI